MMLMLELYWTYVKIAFASFGGLSMVPVLSNEMLAHGWMTEAEVSDIVAIAEMTPGPLALNCASFVGIRVAGMWGALFTTLGVLTPSLTLAFLAAYFLERFKKSRTMGRIMSGVRPAAIGMILAVVITLSMDNYILNSAPYWISILIGAVAAVLLFVVKLNIPWVILISAVLGILIVR